MAFLIQTLIVFNSVFSYVSNTFDFHFSISITRVPDFIIFLQDMAFWSQLHFVHTKPYILQYFAPSNNFRCSTNSAPPSVSISIIPVSNVSLTYYISYIAKVKNKVNLHFPWDFKRFFQRSTGVEMYLRLYALVLGLLLYEWDLAHGAPTRLAKARKAS